MKPLAQRGTRLWGWGARVAVMAVIGAIAALGMAKTTSADPSFGYGGLGPGVNGIIFDTGNGAPVFGPVPPAAPAFLPPAFGLGAAANTDGLSYGDNVFPPPGPWYLAFTVGPGATGHPFTPPPVSPMYPNIPAELGAGDGLVVGDIYSSFAMPAFVAPPGAFAAPGLPAPCGPIHNNIQIADENGVGPFAMGLPNVGLSTFPPGSNLDLLEMNDNAFADFLPPGGDGIIDIPIFFSVDPATAAGIPALPPFFVPTTAADVLAWDPGTGLLYNWAPAAALGLVAGDNIDGLAVGYVSGAAIPAGWAGPPDTILFSLAPGSPSLPALGSMCFGPGTGMAGDVFGKFVPGPPPPMPVLGAEMLGLNTLRSGGFADDNLEDFDIVLPFGIDADGDLIDNAVDLDDDNEGLGDLYDMASGCSPFVPDTDGDGLSDYAEVVTFGTNCAIADTDGDGCRDNREVQTAVGSQTSGGLRNPLNPNDYFNPSGDLQNRVDDILLVVMQYFMDDDPGTPGTPPYAPGYTPMTDRTLKGPDAWRTGPPNGLQRVDDILNSVNSYFHDCV